MPLAWRSSYRAPDGAARQSRRPLASGRAVATIEEHRLARHVVGGGGGEVDDERSDLLELSRPASGHVAEQPLADPRIVEGLAVHVRDEPARGHGVDLDVVPRP